MFVSEDENHLPNTRQSADKKPSSCTSAAGTLEVYERAGPARPAQQIALPMAGDGADFDFCRPFLDGDGINLTTAVSAREPGEDHGRIEALPFRVARSFY